MAGEAIVRMSLTLRKGNTVHQSPKTGYSMNVANEGGPTPGQLTVPTTGIDVDLGELISPGFCEMTNLDATNSVEVGIHDGSLFHPIMELPPGGKPFLIYLSRNLGSEENVPGTGTSPVVNALFLRAINATCKVIVEAFER